MEKKKIESLNGKERRSGADRRAGERRKSEPKSGKGALTTRVVERRQKSRRSKDPKTG